MDCLAVHFSPLKMKAIILRGEKLIYALYCVKYNSLYSIILFIAIFL